MVGRPGARMADLVSTIDGPETDVLAYTAYTIQHDQAGVRRGDVILL